MSFGGFKAFKADIYGVDGGTMQNVGNAIETIANGIINTNEGWQLDTSINRDTSYSGQTSVNGQAQALFLVHSSGAKLLITMNLNALGFSLSSLMNYELNSLSLDGIAYGGLSMCMLEPSYSFNISEITGTTFLPTNAMKIVGTCSTYSQVNPESFLYNGSSSMFMRYVICVRQDQIIVLARRSDWADTFTMYAIGNIFQCANLSDTYTFGAFRPMSNNSTNENSTNGALSASEVLDTDMANAQFHASDGTMLSGKISSGGLSEGAALCYADRKVCAYSFASNYRRFVSINALMKTTQSDRGVIYNDGYKGIINPEVCCITYYAQNSNRNITKDSILDGGKLKYIANGICVGWDNSNTVNFWS